MERRRLLDNGQPIPYWENCVFYAPLTQGDLSDWISGSVCQKYPTASFAYMTFDSNIGAYLFYGTISSNGYTADVFSWSGLNMGLFSDNMTLSDVELTLHFWCRVYHANDYTAGRGLPSITHVVDVTHYIYCPNTAAMARYGLSNDNTFHQCVAKVSGGNVMTYKDGVLQQTYSFSVVKNGFTNEEANKHVTIDPIFGGRQQSGSSYIKDIRIYNRALTAAEIAQL